MAHQAVAQRWQSLESAASESPHAPDQRFGNPQKGRNNFFITPVKNPSAHLDNPRLGSQQCLS
jgi:hypothetical protein